MITKKAGAFSLVEITVAIGVIAFALVAILGLLPIGMKSGRNQSGKMGHVDHKNRAHAICNLSHLRKVDEARIRGSAHHQDTLRPPALREPVRGPREPRLCTRRCEQFLHPAQTTAGV